MLKYHLAQLEGAFVFQIIEQDERVTSYLKARPRRTFHASNDWRITIDAEPEIDIDKKVIFLRGSDKDLDNKIERYTDIGNKRAKKVINDINNALTDLVQSAKTWKRKDSLRFVSEIHIRPELFSLPLPLVSRYNPTIIIVK